MIAPARLNLHKMKETRPVLFVSLVGPFTYLTIQTFTIKTTTVLSAISRGRRSRLFLFERHKAYFSTGGYRALEDEVGTYATDSVLGLQYTNLYRFGDTGKIGVAGQLTIPTSETSRKDELHTAVRLDVPISFQLGASIFGFAKTEKNFHEYKTMGTLAD